MPRTASKDPQSRCNHRSACGRRCRKPAAPESRFCALHQPYNEAEPDLSADLTAGLEEFSSTTNVNEFLVRLLFLLSEGRVSPRRAAVLAYITNQILRTITLMEDAAVKALKNRNIMFPWDPAYRARECPKPEEEQTSALPQPTSA